MYNVQEKPAQHLVKFWANNKSKYENLLTKDPSTVYFCTDTLEIYKGETSYSGSVKIVSFLPKEPRPDTLYIIPAGDYAGGYVYPANGTQMEKVICGDVFTVSSILTLENIPIATETVDGFLSHEDKITYDNTSSTVAGIVGAYPVTIEDKIDSDQNKIYTFKQGDKIVGEVSVPKSDMIEYGSLIFVQPNAIKYNGVYLPEGRYIKITFTDKSLEDIYISLSDLDSLYTAGDGITIENNTISLNVDTTNGLTMVNGKLGLNLDNYLAWKDFKR